MPRKISNRRLSKSGANKRIFAAQKSFNNRSVPDPDYVFNLKSKNRSDIFFPLLNSLQLTTEFIEGVHGPAFPRSLNEVFSESITSAPSSLANEIIWAIVTLSIYSSELKSFITYKEEFELCLLLNDREGASNALKSIETELGWSLWYIQNSLADAQYYQGVEEKRRLVGTYEKQAEENSFLRVLLYFISKRIEGTAVPGYLQTELANFFESSESSAHRFMRNKLFGLSDPDIEDLSMTLLVDSHFSVIDYYESLIATLQGVAAKEPLTKDLCEILSQPTLYLYRSTLDKRLIPILIALDVRDRDLYKGLSSKEEFIESYSKGEYQAALELADLHLKQQPTDMGALVMRVRAELKLGHETAKSNGIVGEIEQHLRNIISLTPDTYSSALSLYALHDRFYGHSWTTFLRAVVASELTSDKFEYPSAALRRLVILESEPTPFSALLQPVVLGTQDIIRFFSKKSRYSATIQVFTLVSKGDVTDATNITEERRRRYLGAYHLARNNFTAAIEHFEWLATNSSDAESLRASAAAAIAYSRSGQYSKSIESLVTGYLKWPHAPTVLPLDEIIAKLEDPEDWPESIFLPLAFELYTSYRSDDRITHLRYAFERFQTGFQIESPNALSIRTDEFGLENVIYYLSNVWRPEVMRQTVLYEGTRQIEEERIKVCQVLAEIDSQNSLAYLAEIRERVKSLEIAKATNLVEQSKVYVDIAAIKKALRTKLGDAYARYKSSTPSIPNLDNPLIGKLSELLSKSGSESTVAHIASMYHILFAESPTELDLQFAAMFKEVTNEFLRGDHGLNAYLSTRVRHGKLSNALRKPAADEFLVTERKEGSLSYVPNYHWAQTLFELNESEHNELSDVLEVFATDLDSIIAHVKDDLIQIKITHDFLSKDTNKQALFSYQTSNLERMYMQTSDTKLKNLDEFIDLCIDALWEKTDANLVLVQEILRTVIRQRLMGTFDDLLRALNNLAFSDRLGELYNHIYRARTSTQTQLMTVTSWFKRSEVYDRQDYIIEFPVLIATNMIRNSISGAGDWEGVTLNISDAAAIMPGRSLDAMVDMFCVLFENAIGHSGECLSNLKVVADLDFKDGCFSATLTNQVFHKTFDDRDEERLERIRSELTKDDNRNRAQKEGRSGFHKLWAIINAPQYRDPSLVFGFTDDQKFEVTVKFGMEVTDESNAYN